MIGPSGELIIRMFWLVVTLILVTFKCALDCERVQHGSKERGQADGNSNETSVQYMREFLLRFSNCIYRPPKTLHSHILPGQRRPQRGLGDDPGTTAN